MDNERKGTRKVKKQKMTKRTRRLEMHGNNCSLLRNPAKFRHALYIETRVLKLKEVVHIYIYIYIALTPELTNVAIFVKGIGR
jgi:hypothetical protein